MNPSKPIIALAIILWAVAPGMAQSPDNQPVKKIEVYGSAEDEITPDEIYFSITLKEYMDENKEKVSIDKLERELYNAVRKIDIPEEDFQIENVFGYNYDWQWRDKKKDRQDFLAQKQYRIKFAELRKINRLFEYLDPKGIQNANISGYSHSLIEQYRRDLKIQALRNAREKADYLLKGIGEERGSVLEVQEINQNNQQPVFYKARGMAMNESANMALATSPNINFQTIKIKSGVRAVFIIK